MLAGLCLILSVRGHSKAEIDAVPFCFVRSGECLHSERATGRSASDGIVEHNSVLLAREISFLILMQLQSTNIRGMFEMNFLLSSSSISTWGTIKTNTYLYRVIQYLHNGV